MRLNRDLDTIYMLKKHSYYCFICKSKKGTLGLLNGGAYKNLKVNDIQYYYKNMDYVINVISKPLNQYTLLQRKVSNAVRSIRWFRHYTRLYNQILIFITIFILIRLILQ